MSTNEENNEIVKTENFEKVPEVKQEEPKKKHSKAKSIVSWILTSVVAILFLAVAAFQVDGLIHKKENYNQSLGFGVGNFIVQTASMAPEYQVGTAVVTKKQDADKIYETYLENQKYNAELDRDDGEDIDGKMELKLKEIEEEMIPLHLSTFGDTAVSKVEEQIDADKKDGKDTSTREAQLNALKKSREEYYQLRQKYKAIDITFIDAWEGSVTPSDKSLTYRTSAPRDDNNNIIPLTHRVREIKVNEGVSKGKGKYTFIVAGINIGEYLTQQNQYQAFQEQHMLGTVVLNSPAIGKFFKFVASPWGLLVLLLIPALYLVISSVLDIFKAVKEPEEESEATGANDKPKENQNNLAGLSEADVERLKQEMLEQMLDEQMNAKK